MRRFSASIDIERPRRVEVSAYGPLIIPMLRIACRQRNGSPGITAGAWLLEMPGFFVQITPAGTPFHRPQGRQYLIAARVVMMCGCTTTGRVWTRVTTRSRRC
jgi:hypothetical protein